MEKFHMIDTQEITVEDIAEVMKAAGYLNKTGVLVTKEGTILTHVEIDCPAILLAAEVARLNVIFSGMSVRINAFPNTETIYVYPSI